MRISGRRRYNRLLAQAFCERQPVQMVPRFLSFAPQKYTRVALLCTTVILIITLIRIQPTGVLQPLTFSTKTEVPQPVAVTTTTEEVTEPKDPYEVYVRYAYYYPISKRYPEIFFYIFV